jgi:hypothetical protein
MLPGCEKGFLCPVLKNPVFMGAQGFRHCQPQRPVCWTGRSSGGLRHVSTILSCVTLGQSTLLHGAQFSGLPAYLIGLMGRTNYRLQTCLHSFSQISVRLFAQQMRSEDLEGLCQAPGTESPITEIQKAQCGTDSQQEHQRKKGS